MLLRGMSLAAADRELSKGDGLDAVVDGKILRHGEQEGVCGCGGVRRSQFLL